MDNHIRTNDPTQSDNEGQGVGNEAVSAMPLPLFTPAPYEVKELPSSADLGTPPVVTLTFADKAQLVIEQTKMTVRVLKAVFTVLATIQTINGAIVMNEPWYKSRRVWGFVSIAIATILNIFKVEVPDGVSAALPDVLMQIAEYVAGFIGGILTLWSWIKPKKAEGAK